MILVQEPYVHLEVYDRFPASKMVKINGHEVGAEPSVLYPNAMLTVGDKVFTFRPVKQSAAENDISGPSPSSPTTPLEHSTPISKKRTPKSIITPVREVSYLTPARASNTNRVSRKGPRTCAACNKEEKTKEVSFYKLGPFTLRVLCLWLCAAGVTNTIMQIRHATVLA